MWLRSPKTRQSLKPKREDVAEGLGPRGRKSSNFSSPQQPRCRTPTLTTPQLCRAEGRQSPVSCSQQLSSGLLSSGVTLPSPSGNP